jgi:hypothetical protein
MTAVPSLGGSVVEVRVGGGVMCELGVEMDVEAGNPAVCIIVFVMNSRSVPVGPGSGSCEEAKLLSAIDGTDLNVRKVLVIVVVNVVVVVVVVSSQSPESSL